MKMLARAALGLPALLACAPALGDVVTLPHVHNMDGASVPSEAVVCVDLTGAYVSCSAQAAQPTTFAGPVQFALVANMRAQLPTQLTGMQNGVVCTQINGTVDVLEGGASVIAAEDGTGNGFPIVPGGSWSEGLSTTAGLYFISTAAAVVACHGN